MRVLIPVDHMTNPAVMQSRCRRFRQGDDQCTVVLVHVSPPLVDPVLIQELRDNLAASTQAIREGGVDALCYIREGERSQEIAALANQLDADLVLLPAD
jgi:nucleotide-binding universal stress UspA family protein